MTTKRMTAHAPASPIRLAGMRESADEVVIRSLTLHGVCGLVKSRGLEPVRPVSHTGAQAEPRRRGAGRATRPVGRWTSCGLFSFESKGRKRVETGELG